MRIPDLLLAAFVIAGGALATALLSRQEVLEGRGVAVDGDTLEILGTAVRLAGIDAPELHQDCTRDRRVWFCGEAARRALEETLRQGPVTCLLSGTDIYGRALGRCSVDGADVGNMLVREGLALAYRGRDYAGSEAAAQAERKGIWAGTFQPPAEYRAAHRRVP